MPYLYSALHEVDAPTSRNISDHQIIREEILHFGGNFWCQRGNFISLRSKF